MKLQFDPNQPHQRDAVAAVVDLFDGQPLGAPEFSVLRLGRWDGLLEGQDRTELGIGNRLMLDEERLRANVRKVQERNDIEVADPAAPLEGWELFDAPADKARRCLHFSVEMETGTGKTYVYLRTIFELSRRYGFLKFVIVVPSVAIREGVLKNIEITASHFRALYQHVPFEHFVYDSKDVNALRQFATSNTLQLMVINIDAFRKNFADEEGEGRSNVIFKRLDAMNSRQPIEFVQAARPIVIVDEPQSVDSTPKAQEAMRALNPLCTLRYSATHRDPYNLVYRLDPVRAFELRLVKQIVVASAVADAGANDAFVRVEKVEYKKSISAKLRIHVQTPDGPREKSVRVKLGSDLHVLSEERACYASGFEVSEIYAEPGKEFVRFSNGRTLRLGEEIGGMRDEVWQAQIKHTIRRHLEKELEVRGRGIKVLTLFFIDRVANYRSYDAEGHAVPGKFALAFERELAEFAKDSRFQDIEWLQQDLTLFHNGRFSQDRKGVLKDTKGDSQADDRIYNLIMREKESLLSLEEPLRFIFSHSMLNEGWDNPNVFQICTLNETRSGMKKRQEIGRGLRLPVDQSGNRVHDEAVNRLYVMANENYEDFAKALQSEYEEDCGVSFGKVPLTALGRISRIVEDTEQPIGRDGALELRAALAEKGYLDAEGRILPAFEPARAGFQLELPDAFRELAPAVMDLLESYRMERHIRRERDVGANRLRKEVMLDAGFQELWNRIKPRTTFRVEFETEDLVRACVKALKRMPKIVAPRVRLVEGRVSPKRGEVRAHGTSVGEEQVTLGLRPLPDLLAYLQEQTELTRSTLARILKESGRLKEFFLDPQRFLDGAAAAMRAELHTMLVDGIKYERISAPSEHAEWEMLKFEEQELVDYLKALRVRKSVYEYVVHDSNVEREFARKLDEREDIKLFVKLPGWFLVDTPVGQYNPDWAILKHDGQALYLVRETKSTKDFMKLRNTEVDKVRCGMKHFAAIGVPFEVVVTADEV